MGFTAGDDAHARRALQALRFDVPAGAAQHLVTRRGEAREVRHVAAGDEADAGRAREESSSSSIQPATTSSITATAGDIT